MRMPFIKNHPMACTHTHAGARKERWFFICEKVNLNDIGSYLINRSRGNTLVENQDFCR